MGEPALHAEVHVDCIGDRHARNALREAVKAAAAGEPVYVVDRGKRVAEIVPHGDMARLRRFAEVNAGLRARLAELGQGQP